MATLPTTGPRDDASPHVVILGAGATRAACPNGDANGRHIPLTRDLSNDPGVRAIFDAAGFSSVDPDFESAADSLIGTGPPEALVGLEDYLRTYFSKLALPPTPTVYDRLLLSLRSTDVVATFNWDPLLAQAHRRCQVFANMPVVLFLHGNVDVGWCLRDRSAGWLGTCCRTCGAPFQSTQIVLPISAKDYTRDEFIRSEWSTLSRAVDHAYCLTIFGYSAPRTDVAARQVLKTAWERNASLELAQIEIVDIAGRDRVMSTWREFIIREHYAIHESFADSLIDRFPRRSCDAFESATLQCAPWHAAPAPMFNSIAALAAWHRPLIEEERRLWNSGKPFAPRLAK